MSQQDAWFDRLADLGMTADLAVWQTPPPDQGQNRRSEVAGYGDGEFYGNGALRGAGTGDGIGCGFFVGQTNGGGACNYSASLTLWELHQYWLAGDVPWDEVSPGIIVFERCWRWGRAMKGTSDER